MTDNTQTIDPATLPRTITDYLRAHRARDTVTAITCFTNDATVIDDGKTYHGTRRHPHLAGPISRRIHLHHRTHRRREDR